MENNDLYNQELIRARAWYDEQERREKIKVDKKKEDERKGKVKKLIMNIILFSFAAYVLFKIAFMFNF